MLLCYFLRGQGCRGHQVLRLVRLVRLVRQGRRRRCRRESQAVHGVQVKYAWYCNAACQRAHRKAHVKECKLMEKELAEKKKSLDVAQKEEGWLKDRVKLRQLQQVELRNRMDDGWVDEE